MNIEYINLTLYIIQILVISFWIYIWYKNYKELTRKNDIEESPYLGIQQDESCDEIKCKNFWKTPIIIEKIIYMNWDIIFDTFKKEKLIKANINEIMPGEIRSLKCDIFSEKYPQVDWEKWLQIKILYKNHIRTVSKIVKISSKEIRLLIW